MRLVDLLGPGSLWYLVAPFQIVVPAVLGGTHPFRNSIFLILPLIPASWIILIYCAWHLYTEFVSTELRVLCEIEY